MHKELNRSASIQRIIRRHESYAEVNLEKELKKNGYEEWLDKR